MRLVHSLILIDLAHLFQALAIFKAMDTNQAATESVSPNPSDCVKPVLPTKAESRTLGDPKEDE